MKLPELASMPNAAFAYDEQGHREFLLNSIRAVSQAKVLKCRRGGSLRSSPWQFGTPVLLDCGSKDLAASIFASHDQRSVVGRDSSFLYADDDQVVIARVRPASNQAKRGLRKVLLYSVEVSKLWVYPDGSANSSSQICTTNDGVHFLNSDGKASRLTDFLGDGTGGILCSSAMLVREYSWRVAAPIGPMGIGIEIPTDSSGLKSLFADRDKPEDGRRPALLHWVAGHYRSSRSDPGTKHWVGEHLRGARDFNWRGLKLSVRAPSGENETSA